MQEKIEHPETIEDIISPEEKVLWKGRRNDKVLNFYLVAGLIITLIIAVLFFSQGSGSNSGSSGLTNGKAMAGFAIIIGFVTSFVFYYNKQASKYAITDKKIIVQHGVLSKTLNYAYYDKIRHIDVSHGLIGSLFNVGTVYVDAGEIITSEMRWREIRGANMSPHKPKVIYYAIKDVENPKKVHNLIERMIEKNKESKPQESINEKIKELENADKKQPDEHP